MERNLQKIGLVNLCVLVVVGGAAAFLAFYAKAFAGQTGLAFLGLGFLVAAVSYFQMRLEESERLEKLEFEELNKSKGSASLFNVTDAELFPAQRVREQFERFFVPGFAIVLFLIQGSLAYWLWRWLAKATPAPLQKPAVAMALFGMFALILFLIGKYSANRARMEGSRLLRPGASYLLLSSYVCFVVTGSLAAVQLEHPKVDLYVARVLAAIVALSAIETIVNLILEIYRPRLKGQMARLIYDSRLVGLLAQPEGLVTTAAHALDYQFGFKVSETWFYRFLERAIAWIILLQVGLLWTSTAIVFISPGEQGLLERFGRPVTGGSLLEPGLHLKLPWPIDSVYRSRTREIQSFNVGFELDEEKGHETTVLWTVPHYKTEFNLLVASRSPISLSTTNDAAGERLAPVDLLTVSVPVQYQIRDLRAWAYHHADASNLLEKLATHEIVRYFVGVDLTNVMSSGRAKAAEDLKQRIQSLANARELGVDILLVGLQDIHPPVKVAKKFEEVNAARQENEAALHAARGYAAKTLAMAGAEAAQKVNQAQAYFHRTVADAQARAARFTNQMAAFRAAPDVFVQKAYLSALERSATNSRKYILTTTNTESVIQFNWEEKLRPDLLDVPLPTSRK
ncbi:MAG: protease modulator HflK [Verrucomicrobia bacterium]|nr:protease modulator HflK [Verrucomicrobiota bacterium]